MSRVLILGLKFFKKRFSTNRQWLEVLRSFRKCWLLTRLNYLFYELIIFSIHFMLILQFLLYIYATQNNFIAKCIAIWVTEFSGNRPENVTTKLLLAIKNIFIYLYIIINKCFLCNMLGNVYETVCIFFTCLQLCYFSGVTVRE